ncbi:hypothetical protein B0H34DRAFT_792815 [Crassisporium funariophilum]|nr:hypothetical protein B0H34DRAFT_792815 [Crassisporium funariophilum]
MSVSFLCQALVVGSAFGTLANAFTFTHSNPTACDNTTFTWSGGQPPFRAVMIWAGHDIKNLSVPSSAFQGNQGSFSTILNINEGQPLVLAMSDAAGILAGPVSDILTVGLSVHNQACDINGPGTMFRFELDAGLVECKDVTFTYNRDPIKLVQPVTFLVRDLPTVAVKSLIFEFGHWKGIVPGGQSFTFQAPVADSFTWKNNLTAGTPVTFVATDSEGNTGGSSSVKIVQMSTDKSCSEQRSSSSSSKKNPGVIAGAAVGVVVLVALLSFLGFLCMQKRRKDRFSNRISPLKDESDISYDPAGSVAPEGVLLHPYRVVPAASNPSQKAMSKESDNQPTHQSPVSSPLTSKSRHPQHSITSLGLSYTTGPSINQSSPAASLSQGSTSLHASGRRAGVNGGSDSSFLSPSSYQSQRVIVHTDITEGTDEAIELPPSYAENRAPIPGLVMSDAPAAPPSEAPVRPRKGNR